MRWVLRVFQSRKHSLMLTDMLEVLSLPYTRVLLAALESLDGKRHTSYRSYLKDVFLQNHRSTAFNYWERPHEIKLYSLQNCRECHIIMYIWKLTQHMVPNIDGCQGKMTFYISLVNG